MYNKNIILNILSSIFINEIEAYVQKCVMQMDNEELEEYFDQEIDYAILHLLHHIIVEDYEIESFEENQALISGTMEVEGEIDGFSIYEGKETYKGNTDVTVGLLYEFRGQDGEYKDLYLELLY